MGLAQRAQMLVAEGSTEVAQETEDERPLAPQSRESKLSARGVLQRYVWRRVALFYPRHLILPLIVFASRKLGGRVLRNPRKSKSFYMPIQIPCVKSRFIPLLLAPHLIPPAFGWDSNSGNFVSGQ
jgi:hypothetical protein